MRLLQPNIIVCTVRSPVNTFLDPQPPPQKKNNKKQQKNKTKQNKTKNNPTTEQRNINYLALIYGWKITFYILSILKVNERC
jgi:hypothetical protein